MPMTRIAVTIPSATIILEEANLGFVCDLPVCGSLALKNHENCEVNNRNYDEQDLRRE